MTWYLSNNIQIYSKSSIHFCLNVEVEFTEIK